jgi:hypothetical protein
LATRKGGVDKATLALQLALANFGPRSRKQPMAITRPSKQSKVEAFLATAADTQPVRKLRGRKRPLALTLPPDLIDAVDAIAAEEDRSRAKMIEIALRRFVQERMAQAQRSAA